MLEIKNLHAKVEEKDILKGVNLEIKSGEIHAIMGPNGSGKSTLASVITGKEEYEMTEGQIVFENENLEQVLVWAINTTSVLSDYKVINEDNYSLCGFHSVTNRENTEKRTKMVYASLRNGKIAVYHCHEIIP